MTESDVSKQIRKSLDTWKISGVVVWWERLNSGKIQVGGRWVQLCGKGTPDYIALIRNKQGGLTVLFIEVKSAIGQLRPDQVQFAKTYACADIVVAVIRDVVELNRIISDIGIDILGGIEFNG